MMVRFLVLNIFDNTWQIRFWVRKCPIPFLPFEVASDQFLIIYPCLPAGRHLDELPFISCIKSERDWMGFMPNNIWTWSGIPLIIINLWLLFCRMPVIYLYNSSFQLLWINPIRYFTANTEWIWICVYWP